MLADMIKQYNLRVQHFLQVLKIKNTYFGGYDMKNYKTQPNANVPL